MACVNRFSAYKSADELKKAYRTESMRLHPDKGGNAADFAKMKAEYEERLVELLNENNNSTQTQERKIEIEKIGKMIIDFLDEINPQITNAIRQIAEYPLFALTLEMFKSRLGHNVSVLIDYLLTNK